MDYQEFLLKCCIAVAAGLAANPDYTGNVPKDAYKIAGELTRILEEDAWLPSIRVANQDG